MGKTGWRVRCLVWAAAALIGCAWQAPPPAAAQERATGVTPVSTAGKKELPPPIGGWEIQKIAAHAPGMPDIGISVTSMVTAGMKNIPLPVGEWQIVGIGTQPFSMPEAGAFGTISSMVLAFRANDRIEALIEINANTLPSSDGWGRTSACAPEQGQLAVFTRYRTGWETSCAFVKTTTFTFDTPGPEAWEQARGVLKQQKASGPLMWLTAGFRVSDRHDLLDVRYHISPEHVLGARALQLSSPEDWTPDALKGNPLRQAAVQTVSAWAAGVAPWMERGLRTGMKEPPTFQLPTANEPPPSYADLKLRELKRLLDDGRISQAVYDTQAAQARNEVPEYKPTTSMVSNSVRKNVSFRSIGTVVDYGIAYLVTANPYISWGIALTLNATDSLWFVLNDQYWDDYYAKQNTHDAERLVDFKYIGDSDDRMGVEARL